MENLATVLIPGLGVSARLYADQIPALWRSGPVTVANHTRHNSMPALARDILSLAPPRFALAGLSMGGYIAFEILRQAPERVLKLALLDTSARPDMPEQTQRRRLLIGTVQAGEFRNIPDQLFPTWVHASRRQDGKLKAIVAQMFLETGPEAFIRQQTAIMARPDSRPGLAAIRCPTLVMVGAGDEMTPPALSEEIAQGIPGARLAVVPDCGHLSTLERPEFVTGKLVEWLEGKS
jgi:pimeloyl-ACP methyl ester carboxylesterase